MSNDDVVGIKKWIFRTKKDTDYELQFGRFSDLYKDASKYEAWDNALIYSNQEDYMQAYLHFFHYLTDNETNNLTYNLNENNYYQFSFYQGSKIINGYTDKSHFTAEVQVAKMSQPNLAVLRSLLEQNHNLRYSKYCIDSDQCITLVFQTSHLDANPYKLYYGLRELATHADHQDDRLTSIYEEFNEINTGHIFPNPSHILKAKSEYYYSEVQSVLNYIYSNNKATTTPPIDIVYLVGSLVYKLDFLLLPEGTLMQSLEEVMQILNTNNTLSAREVVMLIDKLEQILHIKEDQLHSQLYQSIHTFGIPRPSNHQHLVDIINGNMDQLKWYVGQQNEVLAEAVCTFVLGKEAYEHALPQFDRDLIKLYFRCIESELFQKCGVAGLVKGGKIKKKQVLEVIDHIRHQAEKKYSRFSINADVLIWEKEAFGPSFLYMLSNISFDEKLN